MNLADVVKKSNFDPVLSPKLVETVKGNSIREYVNRYASEILGDNLLFSLLFGSIAYQSEGVNDIDMLFVTRNKISPRAKEKMIGCYNSIHDLCGLHPDIEFPGEYITENELLESEKGKGFGFREEKIRIPLIFSEDWDEFNSYRHNLSAIAGPTIFVGGDIKKLMDHKLRSLITLMDTVILKNKLYRFNLNDIVSLTIGDGKEYLGFKDKPQIWGHLRSNYSRIIQYREGKGIIKTNGNKISKFIDSTCLQNLRSQIIRYNNSRVN